MTKPSTFRYSWAQWGDINAFFGLMLDNVAVMVILVSAISYPAGEGNADGLKFTSHFVLTKMIPGTALGVLLGDVVYTWMAFRLARKLGRSEVTAMPLGLDTPSTFGVAFFVLLPALGEARVKLGMGHDDAMNYAWRVGFVVLILIGVFKVFCAPLGNAVRRLVPQAGLLGSLAAIAIALIAFLPLLLDGIAAVPLVGFLSLLVILVTLVAHQRLPGNIPGALAAVVLGVVAMVVFDQVGQLLGWPLVPPLKRPEAFVPWSPPGLISALTADYDSWNLVWRSALEKLPVAIPFALATIVGGIDCTESAAAAGDEYDTRTILLTEGVASVVAGCLGGVIQTTPYIGHPAYKTMGGRAAYTLATALFVGAAGYFGWFTQLFDWLPKAAMFPILVFVGLEITAQSFRATPVRHYAALALAMLPALAALVDISLNNAAGPAVREEAKVIALTVRCLSHGFIVTSLLWAALLASILDRQLGWSAVYSVAASLCALFGIIHSPLDGAPIDLPNRVYRQLMQELQNMSPPPQSPASFLCQSPYHWAGAYALTAAVLVGLALFRPRRDKVTG